MLIPYRQLFFKRLALLVGLVFLSACDRAKSQSYTIPKEERPSVTISDNSTTKAPAEAAKPATTGNMQILPGMAEAAQAAGDLQFVTPIGWEKLAPSGIRKAELSYTGSDGDATITVTVFPGDVGGLLANVNRWRGQVGLPALNDATLTEATEPRIISNHRGTYVRLMGASKSILGGLLPFHGKTWFFKMMGDSAAINAQETALQQFLDSVRIEDPHH
ncbi:MAG: Uncharacterised protein [Opitutia bacterium UBA7350]|nr:MAG: Uncharacterised protein [Opitutae bacterium UBA7350]